MSKVDRAGTREDVQLGYDVKSVVQTLRSAGRYTEEAGLTSAMWNNVTRQAIASTNSMAAAVVVTKPISIVNLADLIETDSQTTMPIT